MRFKHVMLAISIFTCAFTLPAGDAHKLPDGILAHLSIKSFDSLLSNVDAFVVQSIRGTPNEQQYQPGMLPMMANMSFPLPSGSWDASGGIQAVATKSPSGQPQFAVVLKTKGLANFKQIAEENDIELEGDDKEFSAFLPRVDMIFFFKDIGDDRLLCGLDQASVADIAKSLGTWSPQHPDNFDVVLNLDVKNITTAYKQEMGSAITVLKRQIEDMNAEAMDETDIAKPLAAVMLGISKRVTEAGLNQLPATGNISIHLSFSGEDMKLAVAVSADQGSALDDFRTAYAAPDKGKYSLLKVFPAESAFAGSISDVSAMPNWIVDFYSDSIRDVTKALSPEQADALANLPKEFMNLGIKEYAVGSYMADSRPISAIYMECSKPDEFLALMPKAFANSKDLMEKLMQLNKTDDEDNPMPHVEMAFKPNAGMIGAFPYGRVTMKFSMQDEAAVTNDMLIATLKNTIVAVQGDVRESDLAYAMDNVQAKKQGFIAAPEVAETIAGIGAKQFSLWAIRPLPALKNLFMTQAAMAGASQEDIQEAVDAIKDGNACVGVGIGVLDNFVTTEYTIPSAVIGDFIRNAPAIQELESLMKSPSPYSRNNKTKDDDSASTDSEHYSDALRDNAD